MKYLIGNLIIITLLVGCDNKAYDPAEAVAAVVMDGSKSPIYVALKENCMLEREKGVVDGKNCHFLSVTDERLKGKLYDLSSSSLPPYPFGK